MLPKLKDIEEGNCSGQISRNKLQGSRSSQSRHTEGLVGHVEVEMGQHEAQGQPLRRQQGWPIQRRIQTGKEIIQN